VLENLIKRIIGIVSCLTVRIRKEINVETVIAGALYKCIYVAGVMNFLRLAQVAGWRTAFLVPVESVEQLLESTQREHADWIVIMERCQ
jgi:hypothetical protein